MDVKANGGEILLEGSGRGHRQGFHLRGDGLKEGGDAGKNLSSYRRTAIPTHNSSTHNSSARSSSSFGRLPVLAKGRGEGKDVAKGGGAASFGEALFQRKVGERASRSEAGFVYGVAGGGGGIGVAQRAVALKKTGGILSERFLGSNPLLSPAPAELPSLESLSIGGGVVGLPNSEMGGGGLSVDLLRALQKYRVAAETQG